MKSAIPSVLLCALVFAQCVTEKPWREGKISDSFILEADCIPEASVEESIPEMVTRISLEIGMDPGLALALLDEENKRHDARADHYNESSGSHDLGLFQLNDRFIHTDFVPRYWKSGDPFDVFDAESNAYIALSHFKYLLERFDGNILDALRAYNGGVTAVVSNKVKQMTIDYSYRIMRALERE